MELKDSVPFFIHLYHKSLQYYHHKEFNKNGIEYCQGLSQRIVIQEI